MKFRQSISLLSRAVQRAYRKRTPQQGASKRPHGRRRGVTMVLVAMLLLVLLGMLGLTIDTGMMLSNVRQLQNVADAAALAATRDLLAGRSADAAAATARTFISEHNGLTAVNGGNISIPPATGPYAGMTGYAEVALQQDLTTFFMRALPGMPATQRVAARAVAGYEAVSAGEGVAVLDPTARPGLNVGGQAGILVNGRVVVNSQGGGVDENGVTVIGAGVAASGNSQFGIRATDIRVVGGVDNPADFTNFEPGQPSPLRARQLTEPDPLYELPTPTTANGVNNTYHGTATVRRNRSTVTAPNFRSTTAQTIGPYNIVAGDTVLYPGVYGNIRLNGGTTYFMPGIYVLSPQANNHSGFSASNGTTVTGLGVMFYVTGTNYDPATGSPDSSDGNITGTLSADMASFSINGGLFNLSPISRTTNGIEQSTGQFVHEDFEGMLFYQRRWNSRSATVVGNSTDVLLSGTLYARSASVSISGQGRYDAQFIVGSLSATGNGQITILSAGSGRGRANQIFLVE